jgi:hypothetical protein
MIFPIVFKSDSLSLNIIFMMVFILNVQIQIEGGHAIKPPGHRQDIGILMSEFSGTQLMVS